jgi:hypothetical protein
MSTYGRAVRIRNATKLATNKQLKQVDIHSTTRDDVTAALLDRLTWHTHIEKCAPCTNT